ncbi:MAG: enoyl-CoA hydratase/isomerase family protein [Chloroflexi bacterium]|nr:enoyl-CoA hydratase/isomerase family protein [Chloroflexota bacterium]
MQQGTFRGFEVAVQDPGIVTVTFNQPDRLNGMTQGLKRDLIEILAEAQMDDAIRVIVITGAGKAFCSGQDLGDLKEKYVPGYVPHLGEDLRKRYNPVTRRLREMDKPTIAAVNGVAAGAGLSFALACDIRIASERASFIEVFINVGLVPDSGSTWTLPRLVGLGKAMELCFTGDKIDAAEALRIGLVNRVVPADDLVTEVNALAGRIAALPARGIALTKRLLNQSFDNDLGAQLEAEAFAQETAALTEDHYEGVVAFIEKRKPEFKGA